MGQVEKTVFISYRRKDESWALLIYKYLTANDFDVFFDFMDIAGGDFEQIIISNIKARAHFLVILTPTALDRCNEPGDWLRREVETAISEKRNIIPLLFDGFNFGTPSISEKLSGKLGTIKKYNGLAVPPGFFDEAMERLRSRYLNVALDAVLHPISDEVQKINDEQKIAADAAIGRQIEVLTPELARGKAPAQVKKPPVQNIDEIKIRESKAIQLELKGDIINSVKLYYEIRSIDPTYPRVNVKINELEREIGRRKSADEFARKQEEEKAHKRRLASEKQARLEEMQGTQKESLLQIPLAIYLIVTSLSFFFSIPFNIEVFLAILAGAVIFVKRSFSSNAIFNYSLIAYFVLSNLWYFIHFPFGYYLLVSASLLLSGGSLLWSVLSPKKSSYYDAPISAIFFAIFLFMTGLFRLGVYFSFTTFLIAVLGLILAFLIYKRK